MLRTHHRKLTVLTPFVLFALVLGGCAAPVAPAAQAPAEGAPAEKATITMWLDTTGSSETAECILNNIIQPFNEKSTTIEVDTTLQPNSWDATRTALAGGGGPDVVGTPGPSFVFELAKAGQVLPLEDYAAALGWSDTFAPWALKLGLVDGKLYSIPSEVETLVLYYNKTLFEQNGWEAPITIDELMALSEEIAAAGIIPFGHSNAEWRPANEWFVGEMLNHVAGPDKVYLALTGQIPWTDPDFVKAIEMLNTMQQNGWFMGGLDRYYTATTDERRAALADGKAAMNIEGTWALPGMNDYFGEAGDNTNDWDVVPMPSTSGEAIFDLGIGSTYSINANSKHADAVAEFLTYYFSPESQAIWLTVCGLAPAPVNLKADALSGIDPRGARIYEALSQASAVNNYGYTTWTFWPPKSDVYIYEEIEKVWSGDMTAEEYLQGLDELFQSELAAGDIPPIPEREVSQ
jgi:raffinose/stachyose/melibiose transport system substrate-binding protein